MSFVYKISSTGRKKPKNGVLLRIVLVIVFLLLVALLVLNSGFFAIKKITIEGNERMTDKEIMDEFDLEEGVNLFKYFIKYAKTKFSPDPRLSSVDVYVTWPNEVRIVVVESVTIGYIYYQGTYLCLNQNGCVVDSTNYLEESIPIIKGINVGSFSIGDVPLTDDNDLFKKIVSIGTVLAKFEMSSEVIQINVREPENIILFTERIEIRVGDASQLDRKIQIAKSILANEEIASGILHVEDLNGQIYIESKV